MKKFLSILLAAALCLSCLAACGNSGETAKNNGSSDETKLIGVCMQNMSSSLAVLEEEAIKATFLILRLYFGNYPSNRISFFFQRINWIANFAGGSSRSRSRDKAHRQGK